MFITKNVKVCLDSFAYTLNQPCFTSFKENKQDETYPALALGRLFTGRDDLNLAAGPETVRYKDNHEQWYDDNDRRDSPPQTTGVSHWTIRGRGWESVPVVRLTDSF